MHKLDQMKLNPGLEAFYTTGLESDWANETHASPHLTWAMFNRCHSVIFHLAIFPVY